MIRVIFQLHFTESFEDQGFHLTMVLAEEDFHNKNSEKTICYIIRQFHMSSPTGGVVGGGGGGNSPPPPIPILLITQFFALEMCVFILRLLL